MSVWEEDQFLAKKLYKNVKNTADLRKLIFNAKLPFTLLNPKLIVDPFQLSVGITKALFAQKEGTMKTRSLPTEIIYSLSPSKHISESLKIFSAQDGDTDILVIGDKGLFSQIVDHIQGQEIPLSDLRTVTDAELVKKTYGISEEELKTSSLTDSVVSRMSSKEYASVSWSASNVANNNQK